MESAKGKMAGIYKLSVHTVEAISPHCHEHWSHQILEANKQKKKKKIKRRILKQARLKGSSDGG